MKNQTRAAERRASLRAALAQENIDSFLKEGHAFALTFEGSRLAVMKFGFWAADIAHILGCDPTELPGMVVDLDEIRSIDRGAVSVRFRAWLDTVITQEITITQDWLGDGVPAVYEFVPVTSASGEVVGIQQNVTLRQADTEQIADKMLVEWAHRIDDITDKAARQQLMLELTNEVREGVRVKPSNPLALIYFRRWMALINEYGDDAPVGTVRAMAEMERLISTGQKPH